MTPKEMIEVLQAYEAGKEIEFRDEVGRWRPCSHQEGPRWNFALYDYRVKPEEKKLVPHWPAIIHEARKRTFVTDSIHPTEANARSTFGSSFVRLATEYPPIMLEGTE